MKLSIPSKTFICGEHSILSGSDAILISTYPDFVTDINNEFKFDVHENSLAGKLMNFYKIEDVKLSLSDPYNGNGGFGKSGAEFLSVYWYYNNNINISDAIKMHKLLCPTQSGADIVAQLQGNITFFESNANHFSITWPFNDIDMLIFKTNIKINTDDYLHKKFSHTNDVNTHIKNVKSGLLSKDADLIFSGINKFYRKLLEYGFVSDHAKNFVNRISENCDVFAVKGCGAMCNDVIITFNDKKKSRSIIEYAATMGLHYISSNNNLHGGLHVVS